VLFIELLQQPAAQPGQPIVIQARIAAHTDGQVTLELHRATNEQPDEQSGEFSAQPHDLSLGVALCKEICAEMHGSLHVLGNAQAARGCRLQFPVASDPTRLEAPPVGIAAGAWRVDSD
jgi:hypothetical protein